MPLWDRAASLGEIRHLFSEGRVKLGRKTAVNGSDFARAIAKLGVDRGLSGFERFGLLKRSGDSFLATPLGRFDVRRQPEADILQDLDRAGFLGQLRRYARDDKAPGALRMQVHRLENLILALTRQPDAHRLEALLIQIGRCAQLLARSAKGRENIPGLPQLSAAWRIRCDDGSSEFRIAAALASIQSESDSSAASSMVSHLLPIRANRQTWQWLPKNRLETDKTHCWIDGAVTINLAEVIKRRLIDASHNDLDRKPFAASRGARLGDISRFLANQTDDARITDLLAALVLCDPAGSNAPRNTPDTPPIPAAYRLLKPFFSTDHDLQKNGPLPSGSHLRTPLALPGLIRTGRLNGPSGALQHAWRALGSHQWPLPRYPLNPPTAPADLDPQRLLAALLIPLAWQDFSTLYTPITTLDHHQGTAS